MCTPSLQVACKDLWPDVRTHMARGHPRHDRGLMASTTASIDETRPGAWDVVARLGAVDGAVAHPHATRLIQSAPAQRNLSDAVHAFCDVYGRHPGMIDDALLRGAQLGSLPWLETAATGFAIERGYLAQLTAAVGPLPSTPGQAATEAALAGVRNALEILSGSERAGCATGAVAALLHDWPVTRDVLDLAATRFGIVAPPRALPPADVSAKALATLGATPGTRRAITFGAQQLYAQHRGLWSLLEARASARGDL